MARGAFAILKCIREVFCELGVILVLRPKLSHGEFIVVGYLDSGERLLLEQHLLAGEDLL